VTRITCSFVKRDVVASFLDQVCVLKPDVSLDVISIEPCEPTDVVCSARSTTERPFFYMYACLFLDLHVSLPFDNFTVGVLWALNMAPTQLHPNTWASIQASRLICDVFCLSPSPSTFLSYYTSHPTSWLCGIRWLVVRATCSLAPFPLLIRILKRNFLRFSFAPRKRITFLMKPVGPSSPYLGPVSRPSLRNGLVRPRVSRKKRFILFLMGSLVNFQRGSWWLFTCRHNARRSPRVR